MSAEVVAFVMAAVIVGALVKSVGGMGMPIVTIPAISLVAGIEEAVVIGALPNLLLNLALAWNQRSHWSATRDLLPLSVFATGGGVFGTFLLVSLPDKPLIGALILVVVAYVALRLISPTFSVQPTTSRRWAPLVGTTAGIMQGGVGISGPIVVPWIQSLRLHRDAQILSMTVIFAVAGAAQFPLLVAAGEVDGLWLITLAACVPTLATVRLGSRIRGRLSSQAFDVLVVTLLVLSAAGLTWRTFLS